MDSWRGSPSLAGPWFQRAQHSALQMRSDQLFQKSLIPAGQVLTLVGTLFSDIGRRKGSPAQGLQQDTWDLLNMVAVWSLGASDAERTQAGACLVELVKAMAGGPALRAELASLVALLASSDAPRSGTPKGLRLRFANNRGQWVKSLADLRRLIGYHPNKRNVWLEQHGPHARKLGGKPSSWRTYVRNTSWAHALHLLGMPRDPLRDLRLSEHFGSRPGRERLAELWQRHFNLPFQADEEVEGVDPLALPQGLSVGTNERRWLEVRATSPALEELSPQERALFPPGPLRLTLLKPKVELFEVAWDDLSAGIEKALAWRQAHRDTMLEAARGHAKAARAQQVQALRDKLLSVLTPQERELFEDAVSGLAVNPPAEAANPRKSPAKKAATAVSETLATASPPRAGRTRKVRKS